MSVNKILLLILASIISISLWSQSTLETLNEDLILDRISHDSIALKVLSNIDNAPAKETDSIFQILDTQLEHFSSQTIIDINNKRFSIIKDLDRAEIWKKSIVILEEKEKLDSTNLAFAINSLGEWYAHIKERDLAIEQFVKTISLFPEESLEMELGYSYNNLGMLLNQRGDPGSAIPFMEKAILVFSHHLGKEHNYISTMFNNLGMAFGELGNYKKQNDYLLRSLDIRNKTVAPCDQQMYEINNNLGISFRNLENYTTAEKHIKDAMSCLDSYSEADKQKYIGLLDLLVGIRSRNSEEFSAEQIEELFTNYIEISEDRTYRYSPAIRNMYNNAGIFFYGQKRPKEAVSYIQAAIRADQESTDEEFQLPTYDELTAPTRAQLSMFVNLASSYFNLYRETNDDKFLRQSYQTFALCDKITEGLKIKILQGDSRQVLKSASNLSFIMSNRTSFELFKKSGKRKYLETIFSNAEKIKSWELLEKYSFTNQAEQISNSEIVAQINDLKNRMAFGSDESTADSLEIASNLLLEKLRIDYPSYYDQLYGNQIISLDQLQELCDFNNEQWIVYFQLPNQQYSGVFVSKDTIDVMEDARSTSELSKHKKELFKSLSVKNWDFVAYAEQLFDTLIIPFSSNLKEEKLVIQGHRDLLDLPFEILIDKSKMDEKARVDFDYKYLLHDYEISYMHSASLAYQLTDNPRTFTSSLFIAPEYSDEDLKLNWTEQEIIAGKENLGGRLLRNNKKSSLLAEMQSFKHIHFAGHIYASSNLDSTFLLLSDGKDSLFLREIADSDLKSNLLVLSGCDSGLGRQSSEALISPAYAFSFAGSPNVISSLWKTNDESSATLFSNFYQQLRLGFSSISALTRAKVDHINNAPKPERHPYYWASFTHYGGGIYFEKRMNRRTYYLIAGILLFLGAFWTSRKSKIDNNKNRTTT